MRNLKIGGVAALILVCCSNCTFGLYAHLETGSS